MLLTLKDISVTRRNRAILDKVSLTLDRGEFVGLIGPNGAGKTTLMDAISGFAPCTGSVGLAETALTGTKTYRRVRAGLGRTFQAIELYEDLSVAENVSVGLSARIGGGHVTDSELDEIFGTLGLAEVKYSAASELSQGQRQLVSIARALAGKPKVLLLDEPAGGLDTSESLWLGERLKALRSTGVTILLVEHDMGLVMSICDQIHVLDFGKLLASGTPEEILSNTAVMQAYLGTSHSGGKQQVAVDDSPGAVEADPAGGKVLL